MPNQTFFNLPPEKRERIIDAAFEEFSSQSFKNASVAGIVEKAGIPRGSFYQYFTDLKDLYKYLFEFIGEQKVVYMQDVIGKMGQLDALSLIRGLYHAGLKFAEDHPVLAAFGNNFYKEDSALKSEVIGNVEPMYKTFFEPLLLKAQAKGEIDANVDIKIAAYLFYVINISLIDYYLENSKVENLFDNTDGYIQLVEKMLYILEHGLKSKNDLT